MPKHNTNNNNQTFPFLPAYFPSFSQYPNKRRKEKWHAQRGWELTLAQRQGVCRKRDNLVEALEETAIATKRTTRVPNTAINLHRFPRALASISAFFSIENRKKIQEIVFLWIWSRWRYFWGKWNESKLGLCLFLCVWVFERVKLVDGNK